MYTTETRGVGDLTAQREHARQVARMFSAAIAIRPLESTDENGDAL